MLKTLVLWTVIAMVTATAGGCASAGSDPFLPATAALADESTILPLTEMRGSITVPVMVDGAGPFVFKVDTGYGAMVVSPKVAAAAHLARVKGMEMTDHLADGREVHSPHGIARLEELKVGGATFQRMYVRVAKEGDFPASRGVDGTLGFPVLQKLPVILDMPAKQLRIMRQSALSASDATTMALKLSGGVPVITLRVAKGLPAERGVEVVVDTGCTMPLVLPPSAAKAFDAPVAMGDLETQSFFGRATVALERHFTPVEFPGMVLSNNVIVFYADGPVYAMGLPLLRHYCITLDGSRNLMRMELTNPSPPGPWVVLTGKEAGQNDAR